MAWLILLAAFMAVFGVIGYLRGSRAAVFVLLLAVLAALIVGRLGDVILRYINAFGKGFQFLLSGGLSALAGSGSADEALRALREAPPLVQAADEGLVLSLLFVIVILLGLLLSGLPLFKASRSVTGLILGLAAGYIVSAVVVRALTPAYAAFLPLLGLLPTPAGIPPPAMPGAAVAGPGVGDRIVAALNALSGSRLVAGVLAVLIAVFVLVATRSANRGTRKG